MGDSPAEDGKGAVMKTVTIEIEDEVYGFYKSLGLDFEKSVEEVISLAVLNHYMQEYEEEIIDFNTALREGRGGKGEVQKKKMESKQDEEKMNLRINLNIKSTLSKSPFDDTKKLSEEIVKVIAGTEKELNERNIPHCSEYIVNIEGHMPAIGFTIPAT